MSVASYNQTCPKCRGAECLIGTCNQFGRHTVADVRCNSEGWHVMWARERAGQLEVCYCYGSRAACEALAREDPDPAFVWDVVGPDLDRDTSGRYTNYPVGF